MEGYKTMTPRAKETLLKRKFVSMEYLTVYVEYFEKMVTAMEKGIQDCQQILLDNPQLGGDNIGSWETRGLPILQGDLAYARDALIKAQHGDPTYLASSGGNLRGIYKDVDNIGGFGLWWQHLEPSCEKAFKHNLHTAMDMGCNIDYTISGYWQDDEILGETITGPIDENELLNYLKPGETLEGIKRA